MTIATERGLAKNEQEWTARYKARLLGAGIDEDFASNTTNAAEVDLSAEPEDCADAELSYMAEG